MANRDYVLLNNQPFEFTNRTYSTVTIGGSIERSITGKAHKDVVTTKGKWSFSFDGVGVNDVVRLTRVYKTKSVIPLIDYNGLSYNVIISSAEFPENELYDGFYSPSLELEEE